MARVEAGVVTADLQAEVESRGLFYPPDPSSIKHSTIGGNVACNAGGPRCLKYGVTGDYVLGLTVVLADGRILQTGGKADQERHRLQPDAALLTGSEGTLGVITEVLLQADAQAQVRPHRHRRCIRTCSTPARRSTHPAGRTSCRPRWS